MVKENNDERRRASPRRLYSKAVEHVNIQHVEKKADTDFLEEDLALTYPPGMFRIMVQLDADAKFFVQCRNGDAEEVQLSPERAADLREGSLYLFDMLVGAGDRINFQMDDDCVVEKLVVHEIPIVV